MLEVNFMSNEKFKIGNLSGKGLIIAVAASIVVVGAAGFYSYSKISDKLNAEIIGENKDTLSPSEETPSIFAPSADNRSEERRVGKEC